MPSIDVDVNEKDTAKLKPPPSTGLKLPFVVAAVGGVLLLYTSVMSTVAAAREIDFPGLPEPKMPECHHESWSYHNPNGEANITQMLLLLDKMHFNPQDLQTYYDSFTAGDVPSGHVMADVVGDVFDTATHGGQAGIFVNSSYENPAGRRLSTLDDMVAIGNMVGQVWNIVSANSVVQNAGWVGAVPSSYATTWQELTGWHPYSAKPWGDDTPNCNSDWGKTYADWSINWEGNGKYIENAKVSASATAAWGMNVGVNVQASSTPVNIGTPDNPIAQLQFSITFSSQGGLASTYYNTIIVTFDATGRSDVTSNTGSFC